MIRKSILAAVVTAFLLATAAPASAMCTPGRVEVDPKTKKVTLELPRCHPPER